MNRAILDDYMEMLEKIAIIPEMPDQVWNELACFAALLVKNDHKLSEKTKEKVLKIQTTAARKHKIHLAEEEKSRIINAYKQLKEENPKISKETAAGKISNMKGIVSARSTIRKKLQSINIPD